MKKILLSACVWTLLMSQPVKAQSYYYEQNGQKRPDYVEIDGVQYARVSNKSSRAAAYREPVRSRDSVQYYEPEVRYVQQPRYQQAEYVNTVANAPYQPRFYIGADVGVSDLKYSEDLLDEVFNKSNLNYTGVLGVRISRYFGAELFYQKSSTNNKKSEDHGEFTDVYYDNSLSYSAYGLDLLGYVPATEKLDFLFGLGLASYDFKATLEGRLQSMFADARYKFKDKDSEDSDAVRLGIGLQYALTDHVAIRGMGRYIHMFDDDAVKRMMEISLGLRYMF